MGIKTAGELLESKWCHSEKPPHHMGIKTLGLLVLESVPIL